MAGRPGVSRELPLLTHGCTFAMVLNTRSAVLFNSVHFASFSNSSASLVYCCDIERDAKARHRTLETKSTSALGTLDLLVRYPGPMTSKSPWIAGGPVYVQLSRLSATAWVTNHYQRTAWSGRQQSASCLWKSRVHTIEPCGGVLFRNCVFWPLSRQPCDTHGIAPCIPCVPQVF